MIKNFSFSFENLKITSDDLEEAIGYNGSSGIDSFADQYREVLQEAEEISRIEAGYRIINKIELNNQEESLYVDSKVLYTGSIIFRQLEGIEGVVVFVCTAGKGLSDHSKELLKGKDVLKGYLFDVTGSVIVEKALEKLQGIIRGELNEMGYKTTIRQSPGHCGWDVSGQQDLFSLLPEGFCGVTLSGSSLMEPAKSISGIIGFGKNIKEKGRPCGRCELRHQCLYMKDTGIRR